MTLPVVRLLPIDGRGAVWSIGELENLDFPEPLPSRQKLYSLWSLPQVKQPPNLLAPPQNFLTVLLLSH